jgi:hypothetical protein
MPYLESLAGTCPRFFAMLSAGPTCGGSDERWLADGDRIPRRDSDLRVDCTLPGPADFGVLNYVTAFGFFASMLLDNIGPRSVHDPAREETLGTTFSRGRHVRRWHDRPAQTRRPHRISFGLSGRPQFQASIRSVSVAERSNGCRPQRQLPGCARVAQCGGVCRWLPPGIAIEALAALAWSVYHYGGRFSPGHRPARPSSFAQAGH